MEVVLTEVVVWRIGGVQSEYVGCWFEFGDGYKTDLVVKDSQLAFFS